MQHYCLHDIDAGARDGRCLFASAGTSPGSGRPAGGTRSGTQQQGARGCRSAGPVHLRPRAAGALDQQLQSPVPDVLHAEAGGGGLRQGQDMQGYLRRGETQQRLLQLYHLLSAHGQAPAHAGDRTIPQSDGLAHQQHECLRPWPAATTAATSDSQPITARATSASTTEPQTNALSAATEPHCKRSTRAARTGSDDCAGGPSSWVAACPVRRRIRLPGNSEPVRDAAGCQNVGQLRWWQ